jgi:ankyrin repeat protein
VYERNLPANANLENLKKQAKSLLKAVKNSEPATLSRIKPFFNDPPSMVLRDAQLVIARGYGFSSWRKLKAHIESDVPSDQHSINQLANEFLRLVVIVYSETESADPQRWQEAKKLLDEHPQIHDESIHTACAIGDAERVKNWLKKDPALIKRKGGYHSWEPLMYAAYARLPGASTLEVGQLLLTHGADPNAHYMWGGQYKFTALTGVFGQGEGGAENLIEHPDFEEFARLLLGAGADPNDSQAAYNRMFTDDNTCLELLLEFGISARDQNNWFVQDNNTLRQHPQQTLHYQLCRAVDSGRFDRVRLLIEHVHDLDLAENGRTLYQMALLRQDTDLAQLLAAHGATERALSEVDTFSQACLQAQHEQATHMLQENPALIAQTIHVAADILQRAVEAQTTHALLLMIDLGFDVNQITYRTALHQAAWVGRVDMIKILLAAGADPKTRDHSVFSPPLAWALHNKKPEAAEYLLSCDMDIFTAAEFGNIERIKTWLIENPALLEARFFDIRPNKENSCASDWMTPLAFAVANKQVDAVKCLLRQGANVAVNNGTGLSIVDLAHKSATPQIVELLTMK